MVAFVLLLARRVLFRDAREGLDVRQRFYRSLRWTLVLGGILAALVILTSTLPLSPALADLVDRSAMLCVLLIALPGLQLRSLILALAGGRERAGLASRLAARASRLVPLVLAGAAAIGLAGYLNLAWAIIEHFLWLVLVGGLLLLALGILGDLRLSLRRRSASASRTTATSGSSISSTRPTACCSSWPSWRRLGTAAHLWLGSDDPRHPGVAGVRPHAGADAGRSRRWTFRTSSWPWCWSGSPSGSAAGASRSATTWR